MLRIYTGFHCFPSSFLLFFPPLPPPHSIVFHPWPTRFNFIFFSPRDSIKDCQLPSLVHFETMSRVVNNNRGFLQLLADCPAHQRQFLLKTATPQQLHALLIPIRQENKRILLAYRDALLNLARPNIMVKLF